MITSGLSAATGSMTLKIRWLHEGERWQGMNLVREKHAGGPVHYSGKVGETVLELYPKGSKDTSALRFGVRIRGGSDLLDAVSALGGKVVSRPSQDQTTAVIRDPDGHTIELTFL